MEKNSPKTAVLILAWKSRQCISDCLHAVLKQNHSNFCVFVIDNGSTDGTLELVKTFHDSRIKIITNPKNLYFAGGYNSGLKEALKDHTINYFVLLNDDTVVEQGWLQGLVDVIDESKKISMSSSMSKFIDGKIQTIGIRESKDLMGNRIGGLSIGYGESPANYSNPIEIFCPSGVSALYTRKLLEEVGLFDEDFKMYSEDLDLGYRARRKGYRCMYSPKSRLTHLHSLSSGGTTGTMKPYFIKRNNYFVAIKNFPLGNLLLFPIRDMIWNMKNIFGKSKHESTKKITGKIGLSGAIKMTLKAYISVLWNTPKMFIKRFKDQKY